MAIDPLRMLRNVLRVGCVSSTNPAAGTARVYFPDKDNDVSKELFILNRASKDNKDYWVPDVDEQVLCLFLPNISGNGIQEGFILGSFYSTEDAPVLASNDKRGIHFSDGSYVVHDRATGNLDVHASGNINITANGTITINGAVVYIN